MEFTTGIIKEPHFVLIYGPDGSGKTTFAANAPKSIIVGPESGSKRINTARAKNINTYDDVLAAVKWLQNEKHDFKSMGLDSLDWIEPLIWRKVVQEADKDTIKSIEDFGYGKGYVYALEKWNRLIWEVQQLRDKRDMNVIVIAHEQVKTVNDPMQPTPVDRHQLKLHDKAGAKWREAADAVLFATFEDIVFKADASDKKARGGNTNEANRIMYTRRSASFDAKNRFGLPASLATNWSAFELAADLGQPDSAEEVMKDLVELSTLIDAKDKDASARMKGAIEKAGGDVTKLITIRNHARVLAGE